MRCESGRSRTTRWIIAAALGAVAGPAAAQSMMSQEFRSPYEPSFTIGLGGVVNRFDTSLRLDGSTQRGTDFQLEDNGLDHNDSSFEASFSWRFLPKHRLDVLYFESKRSGARTYSNEISIGDSTFPIGATVAINSKNSFVAIDYRYSFVQAPDYEIAVLLGTYGGQFKFDVDAVGNAGNASNTYHKSVSTTLPLPLIGLTFDAYPTKQWKWSVHAEGVKAKIGDVDGRALRAGGSVEYLFTRAWGMGVRYQYVDLKADVTKDNDFNGTAKWRDNSVSLYGKFVF